MVDLVDNKDFKKRREAFEQQNSEMLRDFSVAEWKMPQDDAMAELFMIMSEEYGLESLSHLARAASETKSERAQEWTKGASAWEMSMDVDTRVALRRDFLGACMKKMVPQEFLQDSKKRWESGQFTSVTATHLVIGDIVVPRRGDLLQETKEKDELESSLGRTDITYTIWKMIGLGQGIEGMRPKINGERFVLDRKAHKIVGWKTISVPENFLPQLLEYYAGNLYVLFPIIDAPITYVVREDQRDIEMTFLPHPFRPATSFVGTWDNYCSHKYDGMMIWHEGREYRTKWDPTTEVVIQGEVWEVYMRDRLIPLRPRPGKTPVAIGNAVSKLVSCVRTSALRYHLTSNVVARQVLPIKMPEKHKQMVGAKVFPVSNKGKVAFIREGLKRLDGLGGMVEFGESHMDAVLRELREEASIVLDPEKLVYLGDCVEETDGGTWHSHVYICEATKEFSDFSGVETYPIRSFQEFKNSDLGRPRQVWLARHLDFLSNKFVTAEQMWVYLVMLGKASPSGFSFVPRDDLLQECRLSYVRLLAHKVHVLYQDSAALISSEKIDSVLRRTGYYLTPDLLKEVMFVFRTMNGPVQVDKDTRVNQTSATLAYEASLEKMNETTRLVIPKDLPKLEEDDDVPQTTASPMIIAVNSIGYTWPQGEVNVKNYLRKIFGDDKILPAQELYRRMRAKGYSGARKPAVKIIEVWQALGYVKYGPQTAGGRQLEKMF